MAGHKPIKEKLYANYINSGRAFPNRHLSPELRNHAMEIFEIAKEYGLTHYPVKFVLVNPRELNGIASYTGFPRRMSHWTYGMEFENLHRKYTYGAAKIYELVINTNPIIAYLLSTNTLVEQKLVMIHVCGHADFFYNNAWFQNTDRYMLDQMANNASRVQRIMHRRGAGTVESFLDTCFSIDNLIDPYMSLIRRQEDVSEEEEVSKPLPRLKANPYMDRYINTQEFLDVQKRRIEEDKKKRKKLPVNPERDVLGFLIKHAPFHNDETWKRDILAMVREEAYYFAPQRMTKIMNEGWATFIHQKFMTGRDEDTRLATDAEIIDYCDSQSRAIAQGKSVNPYRLGLALYRNIEERWNKGQFGPEWDRCDNLEQRHNWDRQLGLGKQKIFEIRQSHNDLTFIDEFLTPEFAVEQRLYSYKPNHFGYDEINRDFAGVKDHFLRLLVNGGQPVIQIENADHGHRGELLLQHVWEDQQIELDPQKGQDTLENLFTIWTRPVHIDTFEEDEGGERQLIRWSYDGQEHSKALLG